MSCVALNQLLWKLFDSVSKFISSLQEGIFLQRIPSKHSLRQMISDRLLHFLINEIEGTYTTRKSDYSDFKKETESNYSGVLKGSKSK